MYISPHHREADTEKNLAFARDRAFGVLTVSGPDGPVVAHLPFILNEDATRIEAHVMRSNPLWRAAEAPVRALMVVSGLDGYISPDWYGDPGLVPTRNYVAVHLRGTLRRVAPERIGAWVDRLSAAMEARLAPKPAWTRAKMDPEAVTRLLRMIVPVEMEIDTVEGIWKLNQNREKAQALAAAEQLEANGFGQDVAVLAGLMRDANR